MHAGGKGEVVARGGPGDVESIWVLEDSRVPVRAGKHQDDALACGETVSVDVNVLARGACGHLDWAVETQDLLHGVGPQVGVFAKPRQLLGVLEEQHDSV